MSEETGPSESYRFTGKAKRISQGCCHITEGKTYEARFNDSNPTYVKVLMDNGEWSSDHWFRNFWEVIECNPTRKASE